MELRKPVHEGDHIKGNLDGRIELVEYGDYQCPFCGAAYPVLEKLLEDHGSQIKFVFRNFPLSKIHPSARIASQAAEAAGRQNKFWEMHHSLFTDQRHQLHKHILQRAEDLLLNVEKFAADMEDEMLIKKIDDDFYTGLRSGVNKTPTFFIDGKRFEGEATDLEIFIQTI
ncbi:DsbA family protein [Ferruginibacter albus]|uniref:DsbA family protein n=1 Tax=Ferruginibacter albus TaxID=2875540 RepID=UPI001CC4E56B|nr:thioredoxin domain-containing protein [Ferruginibacter albus]UAY50946.1 DsbA family protein [Ferruginibacter albus]